MAIAYHVHSFQIPTATNEEASNGTVSDKALVPSNLPPILSAKQDLSTALTSIAGLSTSANQTIYTTAENAYATTALTSIGRDVIGGATAEAILGVLGGGTTGIDVFQAETAADIRALLDLEPGTDVQAQSATLQELADLTPGADGTILGRAGGAFAYVTAGTGDMLESVYDQDGVAGDLFSAQYNILWGGAVGDDTTNNDTDFATIFSAANTGGFELYGPPGTYVVTGNIDNFHDVKKRGPWAVRRGTDTFYCAPTSGQTNKLYLAETGLDTNDGLTSAFPLRSLEKASEVIQSYGFTACTWEIILDEGSYGGAIFTRDFVTGNGAGLLSISGPAVDRSVGNEITLITLNEGKVGTAIAGETITGGTSGATAEVVAVSSTRIVATVLSGTWEATEDYSVTMGSSGASGTASEIIPNPKAIIDDGVDPTKTTGLAFGWLQQVELNDIRTQGFNNTSRAGINGSRFCDIRLNNVHDTGSYWGWYFVNHVTYTANGGLLIGNVADAIQELFFVTRDYQAANKTVVLSPGDAGMKSKEFCNGHLDSLVIDNAATAALEFNSGFTANVGGFTMRRCPIGIGGTPPGELHEDDQIVWGTGADACTRKYKLTKGIYRISRNGWGGNIATWATADGGPELRGINLDTNSFSTTTAQNYALGTLYANEHATKGQTATVEAWVKRVVGSNGTLTCQLIFGGATSSTVTLPTTGANAACTVNFEIICHTDGDFQRIKGWGEAEGQPAEGQIADRTETWSTVDKGITLRFTQASASDQTEVSLMRLKA